MFDKKGIEPHFPFGFGLSYTKFSLSDISCVKNDDCIKVNVSVSNIGDYDGDEVVQIYVGSNNKDVDRPVKLLKGFKRVSVKTGETLSVEVCADIDDIKFYNPEKKDWELDNSYTLYIGTDIKNVKEAGIITFRK